MLLVNVNVWAILTASLLSMIIGGIWYGPLFGKVFMQAMGMDQWTPEQRDGMRKNSRLIFLWQFCATVITLYFLAWMLDSMNMLSLKGGLTGAFILWAGVIVPTKLGEQLWGGKMILFFIGAGNMLVTMLTAGAIIGSWK